MKEKLESRPANAHTTTNAYGILGFIYEKQRAWLVPDAIQPMRPTHPVSTTGRTILSFSIISSSRRSTSGLAKMPGQWFTEAYDN